MTPIKKEQDMQDATESLRCKNIVVSLLRGQVPTGGPVGSDMAEIVMQRLAFTGALGYVNRIGMRSSDPDMIAVYERQRTEFKLNAMRFNHVCLQKTVHVSGVLSNSKIPHVIVKGPMRQKQLYDDAYVRPSKDTDVLVSPKNFEAAIRALKDNGYQSGIHGAHETWYKFFQGQLHMIDGKTDQWSIDLHKRLTQPQVENPYDDVSWFTDSVLLRHGDTDLPVPRLDYAALISSLNIVKALHRRQAERKTLGGWRRNTIVHVCDLHVQFQNADAEEITAFLATAKRTGLLSTALLALRVTGAVFDHDFPGIDKAKTKILSGVGDEDLINMLLEPSIVTNWPPPHRLLIEMCRGAPIRMARHLSWYLASILSRRIVVRA
ncbi:MAG: nucleotidyltransferase family protein [Roseobacter sp.]